MKNQLRLAENNENVMALHDHNKCEYVQTEKISKKFKCVTWGL